MIYEEGPPHKRNYIMGVEKGSSDNSNSSDFKDKCIGFGIGNSKRQGEQNAAKMALILYGYLKDDQYTNSDLYYPDWDEIEASKLTENNNFEESNNDSINEIDLDDLEDQLEVDNYSNLFT